MKRSEDTVRVGTRDLIKQLPVSVYQVKAPQPGVRVHSMQQAPEEVWMVGEPGMSAPT